jgi:[ribosomal protein S5]-alanine N-acetyltransferase
VDTASASLSNGEALSPMRDDSYFLKTQRLGFRCWSDEDFPLAMMLWGDARVTPLIGGPFTREQVRERLNREISSMSAHGIQYWPVFAHATSDFAGCAGVRPYKMPEGILELGVHLRPKYWGQGLAKEASRAVLEYAFTQLGARGFFAGHHPENEASRKLLSKLGFAFTHKELYEPTGLQHPSYILLP